MNFKTILSLCDFTGNWSRPYELAGYEVIRVDLQNGVHRDVRLLEKLDVPIYGILAAPPCTVFCKASAWMWAKMNPDKICDGLAIVDACLRAVAIYHPNWWVLENPSGRLKRWLGEPAMRFQPNEYGDPWLKHSCLWGNFTPPRRLWSPQTVSVTATMGDVVTRKFSSRNKIARSATPPGFAQAFFEANP